MKTKDTGLGTELKVMDFRNPTFNEELNTTVRLGYKWQNLKIGEKFILTTGEEAICEELHVCRFKDITRADLLAEHDPNCRDRQGLFNCLCGIYLPFSVAGRNCVVTVVYFRILRNKKGGPPNEISR